MLQKLNKMPGKKGPGRRNHAKGASKGLRWAKGQSCVSNPNTRKFRDAASSQFLHPVSGNFCLCSFQSDDVMFRGFYFTQ